MTFFFYEVIASKKYLTNQVVKNKSESVIEGTPTKTDVEIKKKYFARNI